MRNKDDDRTDWGLYLCSGAQAVSTGVYSISTGVWDRWRPLPLVLPALVISSHHITPPPPQPKHTPTLCSYHRCTINSSLFEFHPHWHRHWWDTWAMTVCVYVRYRGRARLWEDLKIYIVGGKTLAVYLSVKPLLGPVVISQLFCLFLCAILLCKCQGYAWLGLNKAEVKQGKVALPSLHFAGLGGKPAMCIVWSWHFLSHICTMKLQRHYLSCFKNLKQLWILLYLSDHTALFLWFKRIMESSNFTLSRVECVKWSLLKHEPLSSQTWLLKHHRRWHDNVTGQVTLIT